MQYVEQVFVGLAVEDGQLGVGVLEGHDVEAVEEDAEELYVSGFMNYFYVFIRPRVVVSHVVLHPA